MDMFLGDSEHFQIQDLPFAFFALSGALQSLIIVRRIKTQTSNGDSRRHLGKVGDLHLLIGRIGILLLCAGTFLDNVRKFTSAFSCSWPETILNELDATRATERWQADGYKGAIFQRGMSWICGFMHVVLLPLALFSILQILHSGLRNSRSFSSRKSLEEFEHLWFLESSVIVSSLTTLGLYGFIVGPFSSSLEVRHFNGNTPLLNPSIESPILKGLLGAVVWQFLLILVAVILLVAQGRSHRAENSLFLAVNIVSLMMQPLSRSTYFWHDGYSPLLSNLAEQLSIGSQLWADAVQNTDMFVLQDNSNAKEAGANAATPSDGNKR